MSENLTGLRTFLRADLGEPSEGRWTNDDLDRHIGHAVRDLNRVAPREMKATDLTIADPASRAIDISSLTDLINVIAVEYPVGAHPRRLRHFECWGSTLTLLTDTMPVAGASVDIFYTSPHVVDADGSTLPSHLEEVVLIGAAGYAALEYATYVADRVTVGARAQEHYRALGNDCLMQFRQELTALKRERARALRTGELWTEDER
ncbi:hypothetical protein ACFLUT_01030 [Chloroflexota bacterium]